MLTLEGTDQIPEKSDPTHKPQNAQNSENSHNLENSPQMIDNFDQTKNSAKTQKFLPSEEKNWAWTLFIPGTNLLFFALNSLFVWVFSWGIVSGSYETYKDFWEAMLVVYFIFVFFCLLETFFLSLKLRTTKKPGLDWSFLALIFVRNLIFFLNCVPFVQLFGMLVLGVLGLPMLIAYLIMLVLRFREES